MTIEHARVRLAAGAIAALTAAALASATPAYAETKTPRIHEIQGAAHISPMNGDEVSKVEGVVTAVTSNGFWMQDSKPDADPATSEGMFVFTRTKPEVAIGDAVKVDGKVTEYRPGSADNENLTLTEIVSSAVAKDSSGATLPDPTVIGKKGRKPPRKVIDNDATGSVEDSGKFQPNSDGIDFYESMESMRVAVDDAVAVGPRSRFGEIPVLGDGGKYASVRTKRGGIAVQKRDFNPERIFLDDRFAKTPTANVADRFPGRNTGVLDYGFGNFVLQVAESPKIEANTPERETTQKQRDDELAIATANVENLDPGDPASKFNELAKEIVDSLRSPDLVTLEEVQDNTGAKDDGVVAADQTVAKLTAAIKAAGGPSYEWRSIDPEDKTDGGEPSGNIRVGFLYRTDRGLKFNDREGGSATKPVTVEGDGSLSISPGRIDPGNTAFADSRKSLAGEFTWRGKRLIVVANHWNSKGGDQPLFGRFQPPKLVSEAQRLGQAEAIASFVKAVQKQDKKARVVVAGDLNDFEFSSPVAKLTRAGMRDLVTRLPKSERYTYVYQGNSQVLDHVLVSKALSRKVRGFDIVHVNAEYAAQASDHEPGIVRLRF